MRQPVKVRFVSRSIRPRWRNRVESTEVIKKRSAERRRPRGGIYGVGDGVADPGESGETLLDIRQRLCRADGSARFLERFEKLILVPLDR